MKNNDFTLSLEKRNFINFSEQARNPYNLLPTFFNAI